MNQQRVTLMLALSVGLPLVVWALGLVSGSPFSTAWDALAGFVLGIALIIVTSSMWHGTRPLRQLRAKQLAREPNSVCYIAAPWKDGAGFLARVLLVANDHGISVVSPSIEPRVLLWHDILEIRDVSSQDPRPDLCEISIRDNSESLLFLPLTNSGASQLQWWKFPEVLTRLRNARSHSKSAPE